MKFFLFMKSNGYKYLSLRLQTIGDYSSRDSEGIIQIFPT